MFQHSRGILSDVILFTGILSGVILSIGILPIALLMMNLSILLLAYPSRIVYGGQAKFFLV